MHFYLKRCHKAKEIFKKFFLEKHNDIAIMMFKYMITVCKNVTTTYSAMLLTKIDIGKDRPSDNKGNCKIMFCFA